MSTYIHPTAIVEPGVQIGEEVKVWDNVHIRTQTRIGSHCIIGEKTYIAYDVVVGNYVKINSNVYICTGVTIEDFCMVSAHTVFTNDKFPRSGNIDLTALETSDPTDATLHTRLCKGVTIGANATIGPGVTLGEFSMVGMGSVVTRSVPPYQLVIGSPARFQAWICACGMLIGRAGQIAEASDASCNQCGRKYVMTGSQLILSQDRRTHDSSESHQSRLVV